MLNLSGLNGVITSTVGLAAVGCATIGIMGTRIFFKISNNMAIKENEATHSGQKIAYKTAKWASLAFAACVAIASAVGFSACLEFCAPIVLFFPEKVAFYASLTTLTAWTAYEIGQQGLKLLSKG